MEMISVGEIADALTGFPFDSNLFNESEGFPLIRIRNLKQGKTDTLYNGDFDKSFIVKKGDLLIGMDGEFNLVEWNAEDALLNQRVMKIIGREKSVSKNYLKYALPNKLKAIEDATPFVTVKHLSHKKVLEIKIPLPDLKTQQKIASILEQADAARQKRKQANQLTEQFLQSAFLEMFGDPVRNEKGWEKKQLNDVCIRITDGTHQPPEWSINGVPFIFVSNIRNGEISIETNKFITEESYLELTKRCQIELGDVLFTIVGSYGNAAVVKTKEKFAFQRHVAHIKPNFKKILPIFLSVILESPFLKNQIEQRVRGVAQKTLNLSELKFLEIILPPLPLQQKFATLVEQVEQLRTRQRESEKELENLFGSLMQKYFG